MTDKPLKVPDEIMQSRTKLLDHFSGEGPPTNDRWAALWEAGDLLPWDRGQPNPALEDALAQRRDVLGTSVFVESAQTGHARRKRALVPGCGRGYDVLLLSSYGYDAYGLDVSSKAVGLCAEYAEKHKDDYPVKNEGAGAGKAVFLVGNFFADNWRSQVDGDQTFELFYDYTFFCALHPSMRAAWSLRYAQLASPRAETRLICLEFPTFKEPSSGGPPFSAPPSVYLAHLSHPGKEQEYDHEGKLLNERDENTVGPRFQKIAHWQPDRTHDVGRGTDWVSVWAFIGNTDAI
ncbi:Thiopurine S-methyltransferase [Niveomyces insectorum RCEF 264]|uniref:Thiopurine S-methyltransferase n=1 Tax=Niveomyces insectorum RCEF 264 TaxID=1081102 RepID=A0A167W804_9HYPO|nr:Thiopurine S-methyltransferase [Niveomyces insectorum RCEF 264]